MMIEMIVYYVNVVSMNLMIVYCFYFNMIVYYVNVNVNVIVHFVYSDNFVDKVDNVFIVFDYY
jgi:hypothetical protein